VYGFQIIGNPCTTIAIFWPTWAETRSPECERLKPRFCLETLKGAPSQALECLVEGFETQIPDVTERWNRALMYLLGGCTHFKEELDKQIDAIRSFENEVAIADGTAKMLLDAIREDVDTVHLCIDSVRKMDALELAKTSGSAFAISEAQQGEDKVRDDL